MDMGKQFSVARSQFSARRIDHADELLARVTFWMARCKCGWSGATC